MEKIDENEQRQNYCINDNRASDISRLSENLRKITATNLDLCYYLHIFQKDFVHVSYNGFVLKKKKKNQMKKMIIVKQQTTTTNQLIN